MIGQITANYLTFILKPPNEESYSTNIKIFRIPFYVQLEIQRQKRISISKQKEQYETCHMNEDIYRSKVQEMHVDDTPLGLKSLLEGKENLDFIIKPSRK